MINVILTQHTGFLGPIAKILGYILQGIYSFLEVFHVENAAATIILFTFIVNAIMIPLTIKQHGQALQNAGKDSIQSHEK